MSKEKIKKLFIHLLLFIATLFTTIHAGEEWTHGKSIWMSGYTWNDFWQGLHFAVPFLLILTVHEFGHYFTAIYHKVKTTLPFYIPFPPVPLSIGTMGAVIRIKERVKTTIQHFDIGIAGPLAGFILAIGVIWYGFENLPPKDYIFDIHPEYEAYGENYEDLAYASEQFDSIPSIKLGQNLTFLFFEEYVADPSRVPDHREMMHYPYLFAGFLALFFTALNLLPVGQLDGGHVLYGLFGKRKHAKIARVIFLIFLFYAGIGYITPFDKTEDLLLYAPLYILFLYFTLSRMFPSVKQNLMVAMIIFVGQFLLVYLFPTAQGYAGWLLFAFLVGRIIGVYHPGALVEQKLDLKRRILGWIALIIFIISFSPAPLMLN